MIRGSLFTRFYLEDGIRDAEAYRALDGAQLAESEAVLGRLWSALAAMPAASEDDTETVMILPVLAALGWRHLSRPPADAGRRDIADAVLFRDDASLEAARRERHAVNRLRHGTVITEWEARDRPLDRASGGRETPSNQVLRYMRRAAEQTHGEFRWGLLTTGRLWRLYDSRAPSRAEGFVELDLGAVLALPPGPDRDHWLRVFLALFRPAAFAPGALDGSSFLDEALAEGRRYEQRVTAALSGAVFNQVFPEIVAAIGREARGARPEDAAWREVAREAALRLLYRLLFVLYAEDRDLLPVHHPGYQPSSLRKLRLDAERRVDSGAPLVPGTYGAWNQLQELSAAIAHGNPGMGMPPYNGGLFSDADSPLLDAMSRVELDGRRQWINYRDLSVQHLGGIYERLLERDVVADGAALAVRADADARHAAGAYYTPEELVRFVLARTIAPLLAERREAFRRRAEELGRERGPVADRLAALARLDPASSFLALRVCDPAMGSGHFLVSLVDYLAGEVLIALAMAPAVVTWGEYRSPLAGRIEQLRARILDQAEAGGWRGQLRDNGRDQLDDRHLVRRIILKRVVHGVDLNPMAVELAKLSLWLHSFTVGAPLSFLDHHLRAGNSLAGEFYGAVARRETRQGDLFLRDAHAQARGAIGYMARIEDATDSDLAEVEQSAADFGLVDEATRPLRAFLDLVQARPWLGDLSSIETRAFAAVLDGALGNPVALAQGIAEPRGPAAHRSAAARLLPRARALAAERRFLHWQIAFPGVWTDWERAEPPGGFDAVIGNPPYVRQEAIREQKPALAAYRAYEGAADLYVYFVERALSLLRPGGRLAFVLTNKWFKAAYAEKLRGLLADHAWVEDVTDFGHARSFFADADVMPCVATVRRPDPALDAPAEVTVAPIPSADVGYGALEAQVAAARFALPRGRLGHDAWMLEPPEVLALLDKLERGGRKLREYVGEPPRRGVLTGLNEAFVVDQATRDRLIGEDARSEALIRPFLRGQDVGRWAAESSLSLITIASSGDHRWPWSGEGDERRAEAVFRTEYPAIYAHMRPWRDKLAKRSDRGRFWWELRACAYWQAFAAPKIVYQEIQFYPAYALDPGGHLLNNTSHFLLSDDPWLLACLNAPLLWWRNWRKLPHGKDEALRPFGYSIEVVPIPDPPAAMEDVSAAVAALVAVQREANETRGALARWYRHEWGIERPPGTLLDPFTLDADGFAATLRRALPRKRRLTSAELDAMAREHAASVAPTALRLAQAARHERRLATLVEQAYGLSDEERALMWRTAPPRMPPLAPA